MFTRMLLRVHSDDLSQSVRYLECPYMSVCMGFLISSVPRIYRLDRYSQNPNMD